MQFQASLAGFKAIVARAGAESRAAQQTRQQSPTVPDSLPLGITKATALDIFSGAMLQLKDKTFVFCELGRNCARDAGRDIELITSVGPQARRKFRKAAWLDANVESVAYKALRPGIWEVGSTPTIFEVPGGDVADEEHLLTELLVIAGGTPSYPRPITDALAMATYAFDDQGPLQWTPWKERSAPAAPPAPPAAVHIPAADLGQATGAARILLASLGIKPVAAGYTATQLAQLASASQARRAEPSSWPSTSPQLPRTISRRAPTSASWRRPSQPS